MVAVGVGVGTVVTVCLISACVVFMFLQRRVSCRHKEKQRHTADVSNKVHIDLFQDHEKSPDLIPSVNKGEKIETNLYKVIQMLLYLLKCKSI